MQNLMVTGGAGFIGSNFVRYMLDKYPDYRILVYDKLTYAGNLDNLLDVDDDPRYTFVQGDICDADAVAEALKAHQIDTIVNFAAESHVDRSIMDPDAFIKTDVYGTYVLAGSGDASSNWSATTRSAPTRSTATSTAITAPSKPTRWRRAAPMRPARPAAT